MNQNNGRNTKWDIPTKTRTDNKINTKTMTDPLANYRKLIENQKDKPNFKLKTIGMNDPRKIIKEMKPANSCGMDFINMKTIVLNITLLRNISI